MCKTYWSVFKTLINATKVLIIAPVLKRDQVMKRFRGKTKSILKMFFPNQSFLFGKSRILSFYIKHNFVHKVFDNIQSNSTDIIKNKLSINKTNCNNASVRMIILHCESIYKHLEFILKSSIEKRVAINSKSLLSTRKTKQTSI